jgi:guanylate kinase
LSRSWTTRAPRPGEGPDAYEFVSREAFDERVRTGGFLEWAEFLGNLYGTPTPDPPRGKDVLLEIDIQGARQVKEKFPDSVLVLLLPPSVDLQAERLAGRGESHQQVARRLEKGREEVEAGRALADHVVVNDDIDRVVSEVLDILDSHRRGGSEQPRST